MKATALILAALAAGCAAPVYVGSDGMQAPQQAMMECEYEGEKASAGIRSVIESAYTAANITNRCLNIKGYWRR